MSHAIPFALKGENVQAASAPVAPPTQVVPLRPAAAPITTIAQAREIVQSRPSVGRPTYANHAGEEWATREFSLVENAFRTGGLEAAYKIVPHRTKPAVRGRLQRAGLIPRRTVVSAIP